MQLDPA